MEALTPALEKTTLTFFLYTVLVSWGNQFFPPKKRTHGFAEDFHVLPGYVNNPRSHFFAINVAPPVLPRASGTWKVVKLHRRGPTGQVERTP